MSSMHGILTLLGRVLLSAIFILAGWQKITGYDATLQYMQAFGVPGVLLPLVILAELGGGLAILFGVLSRWAALALAGFCIVAALVFHANFDDAVQQVLFLKNLAIAGGLLMLAANGPGPYALRD